MSLLCGLVPLKEGIRGVKGGPKTHDDEDRVTLQISLIS
jgi:hypothetical protein